MSQNDDAVGQCSANWAPINLTQPKIVPSWPLSPQLSAKHHPSRWQLESDVVLFYFSKPYLPLLFLILNQFRFTLAGTYPHNILVYSAIIVFDGLDRPTGRASSMSAHLPALAVQVSTHQFPNQAFQMDLGCKPSYIARQELDYQLSSDKNCETVVTIVARESSRPKVGRGSRAVHTISRLYLGPCIFGVSPCGTAMVRTLEFHAEPNSGLCRAAARRVPSDEVLPEEAANPAHHLISRHFNRHLSIPAVGDVTALGTQRSDALGVVVDDEHGNLAQKLWNSIAVSIRIDGSARRASATHDGGTGRLQYQRRERAAVGERVAVGEVEVIDGQRDSSWRICRKGDLKEQNSSRGNHLEREHKESQGVTSCQPERGRSWASKRTTKEKGLQRGIDWTKTSERTYREHRMTYFAIGHLNSGPGDFKCTVKRTVWEEEEGASRMSRRGIRFWFRHQQRYKTCYNHILVNSAPKSVKKELVQKSNTEKIVSMGPATAQNFGSIYSIMVRELNRRVDWTYNCTKFGFYLLNVGQGVQPGTQM
ncbi:hypothetical protein DFH06DRAFT_1407897 [Mycena polygramma]|nr:hypothetical protein DFH06DRAFT_1407897 [Mycena polygramma]